jgi:hypothetical protein
MQDVSLGMWRVYLLQTSKLQRKQRQLARDRMIQVVPKTLTFEEFLLSAIFLSEADA